MIIFGLFVDNQLWNKSLNVGIELGLSRRCISTNGLLRLIYTSYAVSCRLMLLVLVDFDLQLGHVVKGFIVRQDLALLT